MAVFLTSLLGTLPGAVAQGLIWGIMAIGVYITFRILDLADLTVDGSICTGAAVCTILVRSGMNIWPAILISFLVGMAAGCVTGFFHISLGIPAILAGILTQLMLYSVNLKILAGANLALSSRTYQVVITSSRIPQALLVLAVTMAIIVAVLYFFFGTELGSAIRATGSNPEMSRAQSINTNITKLLGFALSNAFVALSGAMLAQYQGSADINMGRGAIVIGLASVIIGEAIFRKFSRNFALKLLSVFVGAIIYYMVLQIVIFIGADTDLLKMMSAFVVAVFLGVPYLKKQHFTKAKIGVNKNA
ncbi:MAG: ABC transporter permease [Clostridia bacterium]|nr:ABC transporter permease [Clostridia bacterium]